MIGEIITTRKKITIATMWVIGIYGLSQIARLGSNLYLTRLLEPEMFGIMAVVAVVAQGLIMFSDLGLWTFVVRHKNGTDEHLLNVVWTIQVIRGWVMFVILTLSLIAWYGIKQSFDIEVKGIYEDDDFYLLILLAAATAIISGYNNLAPAIISRTIKRGKLELIELASQVSAIVVMISWALISPSVWALASAFIVIPIVKLFLLQVIFPFKHKLTWDKKVAKEIYDFGKWIVLASVLTYIAQQGDRLYFGSYISPALLGVYSIAFMINTSVYSVMQELTYKIWFPVLSRVVNEDINNLKRIYYKIRLKQDLVLFSLACVLYFGAQSIIDFLYDDRYKEAGWVLQVLSISLVGQSLSMTGLECLSALGITKYRVMVMLVRSIGILIGLPISFYYFSFEGAVYCVSLNVFLSLPIIYWELYKHKILSLFSELRLVPVIIFIYLLNA